MKIFTVTIDVELDKWALPIYLEGSKQWRYLGVTILCFYIEIGLCWTPK